MIVLVPLIVITVLILVLVFGGKLLYDPPPNYVMPDRPTRHVAISAGEIRHGGRMVQSLSVGDTVWIVRAGNGTAVAFTDSTGARVLGTVSGMLSAGG